MSQTLIPPINFAMVDKGIFRSGFPEKKNFDFLKRLKLKTIIYLCQEEYPETHLTFLQSIQCTLIQTGVSGNKAPFNDIVPEAFIPALEILLSDERKPILIHCNQGKHRTGCLVACYRKIHGWLLSSIFAEYRKFAMPKQRFVDEQFIEIFDVSSLRLKYFGHNVDNYKSLIGPFHQTDSSLSSAPSSPLSIAHHSILHSSTSSAGSSSIISGYTNNPTINNSITTIPNINTNTNTNTTNTNINTNANININTNTNANTNTNTNTF